MYSRLATQSDAAEIDAFRCARTAEAHEVEVEDWIRGKSLAWCRSTPGARLLLFYDDADVLVAVAGHEPLDEPQGRFIPAVGVSVGTQGQGVGPRVLYTIWEEANALAPGGVLVWYVHPRNHASQRMCAKLGFDDWTSPPDRQPMMEYVADLL